MYKNLVQIRTQIFQPEKETTVLKGMFWTSESPPANTIGVLESPQELRSFIAIINLSTDIERKLCVALPGLDIESETIYERWKMVVDSNTIEHNPNIDIIFFDPAYISDSDYKFLPARIWRKQIKIGNN
ncbi:MAG: hypothetical protein IPL71_12570 [Anaerolineales bacterium]|uniref:hypothetical protein n=1 Tax=Candidatus Villigracilis proximus TaxID=3140683 RepID=UPI003136CD84|nr:hypothetical protein [Anaerolineales bacterium]